MENKRIPSTDPSTWSGTFNVGDKVKVRIDFSDIEDTDTVFEIVNVIKDKTPFKLDKNGNNVGGFARPENPSGSLYILSNTGNWEGKDLELASGDKTETQPTESKPIETKPASSVSNSTIKEKIDALQLVPLFPDTNYFEGKDPINNGIKITADSIAVTYLRREANLEMTAIMFRSPFTNKKYGRVFMVVNTNENTRIYENYSSNAEQEYLDNLTELLNKYNEYYEATAKVFNEELMKTIKEELEKEKEKQKQKEEQEKQEQEEKGEEEKSKEQEKSEGEEGEGGEGEEGEGEKGEGEMSSEEIQKMIDELSKDQSGQGQEGQSDNKGDEIDLEDFLNEVEKGNADNDFGKDYNNKDLKGKIDYEKQQQEQPDGQEQPKGRQQEPKYTLKNVLGTVKEMFNTNDEDMKRRFPNPTSISDFVDSLSKAKIEELSNKVGLPSELSNLEKTKQIKTNLITEIQNI